MSHSRTFPPGAKAALAALALLPALASAEPPAFDLAAVCSDRMAMSLVMVSPVAVKMIALPDGGYAVLDKGFCAAYLAAESGERPRSFWSRPNPALLQLGASAAVPIEHHRMLPDLWKVRLYMSHSFTSYMHSDVTFRSSQYDVEIQDYEWAERGSREFFEPQTWRKPGNNPLQIFDEPTNTFVVSIEKNGHEFFLSMFHPKFLQAKGQFKYMQGTIDGVPIDGWHAVTNDDEGMAGIQRNENTYRQVAFEIGYGYRIKLFDSKYASVSYVPGIGVGVMTGGNLSVLKEKNWNFKQAGDAYGVQGFGVSLTNRIELNGPGERVGVFYENKLSHYGLKHGFQDGTQQYDLNFMGNSVGLKFMVYDANKHRRKRKIDDCPLW